MRGKKARQLRKEAGGNETEYDIKLQQQLINTGLKDEDGNEEVLEKLTYLCTLNKECSRYKYKQLKKQHKQ